MLDIREIELEIVDQTQTPRYISMFEPLLYVPTFTQKDFHYVRTRPPTKGTSTEEFAITKLGVHNYSLQHNHLYTRGKAQSQNNNNLYTRGIKAQSQTPQQSPLHKRDNHKLNHLYTRGTRHKAKGKERLQTW